MKNDYDPDFSYLVRHRRHAARLALMGYALVVFMVLACLAAMISGLKNLLRFL